MFGKHDHLQRLLAEGEETVKSHAKEANLSDDCVSTDGDADFGMTTAGGRRAHLLFIRITLGNLPQPLPILRTEGTTIIPDDDGIACIPFEHATTFNTLENDFHLSSIYDSNM
jgi:hypothetical protein